MKIHGTAKGGAESKKDFGVAFGGGTPEVTYWYEQPLQNNALILSAGLNYRWTILAAKNTTGSDQSTTTLDVYLSQRPDGSATALIYGGIWNASQVQIATGLYEDGALDASTLDHALSTDTKPEYTFTFDRTDVPNNGFVGIYTATVETADNWTQVGVKQDTSPCSTWGIGNEANPPATTWQPAYTSACFTCKIGG